MAENFEECVVGLNMVKNDLQEMQHPIARRAQEFIMYLVDVAGLAAL